jgi:hypothetical protein
MSRLTRNQKVVSEGLSFGANTSAALSGTISTFSCTAFIPVPRLAAEPAALAKADVKAASGDDAFVWRRNAIHVQAACSFHVDRDDSCNRYASD